MINQPQITLQSCISFYPVEIPKTLTKEAIEELNELGKKLYNVCVRLPSEKELADAKKQIEAILPPNDPDKYVQPYYARNVLIAFEYAKTHYNNSITSILDDIISGKAVSDMDISEYCFYKIEFGEKEAKHSSTV